MQFHIGTGSWADPEYKALLAAPGVPPAERLRAYAAWFDHVELNATYHRIPAPTQTAAWVRQTPEGFTFDYKLHRRICERPADAARDVRLIGATLASAKPFVSAGRLGCFLLLLSSRFQPGRHRLEELDVLIDRLAPHPVAVELRHHGWVAGAQRDPTLAYFRERKLVWVAVDLPRIGGSTLMPPVDEVTHPKIAYLRLHGRNRDYATLKSAEEKHTYAYSSREISGLAKRARVLGASAEHVHVIANNHAKDFAPRTALALQRLLRPERTVPELGSA